MQNIIIHNKNLCLTVFCQYTCDCSVSVQRFMRHQTGHYHSSIKNNKGKICEEIPNFVVCHIIINYFPLTNAVYNSAKCENAQNWTQHVS